MGSNPAEQAAVPLFLRKTLLPNTDVLQNRGWTRSGGGARGNVCGSPFRGVSQRCDQRPANPRLRQLATASNYAGMMRRARRVLEAPARTRAWVSPSSGIGLPAGINRAVGAGWERPPTPNKPANEAAGFGAVDPYIGGGSLPAGLSARRRRVRFGSMRANRSGANRFRERSRMGRTNKAANKGGVCPSFGRKWPRE